MVPRAEGNPAPGGSPGGEPADDGPNGMVWSSSARSAGTVQPGRAQAPIAGDDVIAQLGGRSVPRPSDVQDRAGERVGHETAPRATGCQGPGLLGRDGAVAGEVPGRVVETHEGGQGDLHVDSHGDASGPLGDTAGPHGDTFGLFGNVSPPFPTA